VEESDSFFSLSYIFKYVVSIITPCNITNKSPQVGDLFPFL